MNAGTLRALRLLFVLAVLFALPLPGCRREETTAVDLNIREALQETPVPASAPVAVVVAGMIVPREAYAYYSEFLGHLGQKVGRPIKSFYTSDYAEANRLLRDGSVDIGFVCSGPYVDGHRDFGLEILAVPQVNGVPAYFSYLIAPASSRVKRIEDLRGKSFAFTDPASNTGCVYPTYLLAGMNETPERFFKKVIYTTSHDKSIVAVADHLVDGAAVDSLIYDYLAKKNPEVIARTRIFSTSPRFGIPPVVFRQGLDPGFVRSLREAFLNAHLDEHGRSLLEMMMIERFIPGDDSLYDSIREMKAWTDKAARPRPTGTVP